MRIKQKLLSIFFSFIFISNFAFAGKIDVMTGYFNFSGEASGRKSTVSGAGLYEISYLGSFAERFEFLAGYSLTMTGIIGGDMSYGPKIGLSYYPINFSSNERIQLEGKTIEVHDFLKPYIGFTFNQRQFQSVRNSYAGLGLSLGAEKYINQRITIKSELKLNSYNGPSNSTASEMNLLVGLVYGF